MIVLTRLRDFVWVFLLKERLGFSRPSPVTPDDVQARETFTAREVELARAVARLDATREIWGLRPKRTPR